MTIATFAPVRQPRQHRPGDAERSQRIDLELPPYPLPVEVVERLGRRDAGIGDQHVDRALRQRIGEALHRRVVGHLDALVHLDAERVEIGGGGADGGDDPVAAPHIGARQRKPDAAVGAGYDDGCHLNNALP